MTLTTTIAKLRAFKGGVPGAWRGLGATGLLRRHAARFIAARQEPRPTGLVGVGGAASFGAGCRGRRGFTLVEVLVAVTFMAIVIPVSLSALRVASMAGESGQRRLVAARIANKVLNDLKVENQLQGGGQQGLVQEKGVSYKWSEKNTLWTVDSLARMEQATVTVQYTVAGRPCSVALSTLYPQAQ